MRRTSWRADFRWQSLEGRLLCDAAAVATARPDNGSGTVHDLGTISSQEAASGIWAVDLIPAGGQAGFRLKLEVGGDYVIWCRSSGDPATVIASLPAGDAILTPVESGPLTVYRFSLEAGENVITAVSGGNRPINFDWDMILDNGVGQVPAIALSVTPTTGGGGVAPLDVAFAPSASPASAVGGATPTSTGLPATPASPAGLSLNPEPVLIGGPTSFAAHVDVVGPVVEGGAVALADAGSGLTPNVIMPRGNDELAGTPQVNPAENRSDADARSARADSSALAATEWVERAVAFVRGRSSGEGEQAVAVEESNPPDGGRRLEASSGVTLRIDDGEQSTREGSVPAVWFIPVVALAARYRGRVMGPAKSDAPFHESRNSRSSFSPSRPETIHPSGPASLPRWMRDPTKTRMRRSAH